MTSTDTTVHDFRRQFFESVDKTHIGAAASKLFSASIGDIVLILSRSATHKFISLADIEWMVLPAVMAGQFYVVEAAHKEHGFRAPIAYVSWAFVSEEVDQLLRKQAPSLRRLRPDQWKCGEVGWLIDAVGEPQPVQAALQWLATGPFREHSLKMNTKSADGTLATTTLQDVLEQQAKQE